MCGFSDDRKKPFVLVVQELFESYMKYMSLNYVCYFKTLEKRMRNDLSIQIKYYLFT